MKQFVSKQVNMFAKQSKKSVLPVLCDISISAIPADHIGAGKEWEREERFESWSIKEFNDLQGLNERFKPFFFCYRALVVIG